MTSTRLPPPPLLEPAGGTTGAGTDARRLDAPTGAALRAGTVDLVVAAAVGFTEEVAGFSEEAAGFSEEAAGFSEEAGRSEMAFAVLAATFELGDSVLGAAGVASASAAFG